MLVKYSFNCSRNKKYNSAVILFVRISLEEQTVNLDKPFANGLACKFPQVTINANDIQVKQQLFFRPEILKYFQELKILKSKADVEAEKNASSFTSTVSYT